VQQRGKNTVPDGTRSSPILIKNCTALNPHEPATSGLCQGGEVISPRWSPALGAGTPSRKSVGKGSHLAARRCASRRAGRGQRRWLRGRFCPGNRAHATSAG